MLHVFLIPKAELAALRLPCLAAVRAALRCLRAMRAATGTTVPPQQVHNQSLLWHTSVTTRRKGRVQAAQGTAPRREKRRQQQQTVCLQVFPNNPRSVSCILTLHAREQATHLQKAGRVSKW